jgi:hypothetical protein
MDQGYSNLFDGQKAGVIWKAEHPRAIQKEEVRNVTSKGMIVDQNKTMVPRK